MKTRANIKRYLSVLLVVTLFFEFLLFFSPNRSYAMESNSYNNDKMKFIVDQFSVSPEWIQKYLNDGYTLNHIESALHKSKIKNLSFEEALSSLFPVEVNLSTEIPKVSSSVYGLTNSIDTVTSTVYELPHEIQDITFVEQDDSSVVRYFNPFTVTEEVYGSTVTEEVYGSRDAGNTEEEKNNPESDSEAEQVLRDSVDTEDKTSTNRVTRNGEQNPILEKAPEYNTSSFNDAPYSVGSSGETISSISGSLSLEQTDITLPGRNGLSFSLTRRYDSGDSQFYDMDYGYNTYEYDMYRYFVQFNAIRKQLVPKYHVNYRENEWIQNDYNGDGIVDYETAILETYVVNKGVYNTEIEARQVASQRITYTTPEERKTVTDYRYSSTNSFPGSVYYSQQGFSGTLTKNGDPYVVSGSYVPPQSRTETSTCINEIPGKYNASGQWVATGTGTECPSSKSYNSGGFSGTLYRTTTDTLKACPSPGTPNYICTKRFQANYSGTVTKPGSDTRQWGQNYTGIVIKPAVTSDRRYGPWISSGPGPQYRYAYNVADQPWVDLIMTEGASSSTTLVSQSFDYWSEGEELRDLLNGAPGAYLYSDDQYNYYVAAQPNASIQAYVAGIGTGVTYYNQTSPKYEEQLYPLGKGWSWKLPSMQTKDGKQYLHLGDGGSYEVEGNKLKGYDWEGISLTTDTSVTVGNEASKYKLSTADGQIRQYFSSDGRILQISDAYNNSTQFFYTHDAHYGRKLLSQVKDAIGNTIELEYTTNYVAIKQGQRTITYEKALINGAELLGGVIDELGRRTNYSYKVAPARFNLFTASPERAVSNPYALLTSVIHPTGAITQYTYDEQPIKRYIGESSQNESYRILSRKDQIQYEDGTRNDYNRKNFFYAGDAGSSYGQTLTFASTLEDGLTSTRYQYTKRHIDNHTSPQFYLDQMTTSAEGTEKKTSYRYSKNVGNRSYPVPAPTSEVTTNNRNSDTLTVTKQYDDYGNIVQATNERGATITNTYDSSRHWLVQSLERVATGVDLHTTYTRNAQGDITELIVRQDHANGQVVKHIQFGYDSYGNLITETTIQGDKRSTVTTEYAAAYQSAFPTRQKIPVKDADGNISEVSVSSTYDPTIGVLTSFTDARQQTTNYRYDDLGRVKSVTYPNHHTLAAEYDDINNTVTVTNELGQKSRTRWNALGWKLEEGILTNRGLDIKSRTGYDSYGRAVWSEDALGQRTQTSYDSWSRQTITVFADATQALTQYDDASRIQSTWDAEGNVHREYYDIYGQMVKSEEKTVQDQTGRLIVQQSMDPISGHVLKQTDAKGNVIHFGYTSLGQLKYVRDALNNTTEYAYDSNGNLVTVTDPNGTKTHKSYDELNRVILTRDKAGQEEKRYYDGNGNLVRKIDRNGHAMSYRYDNRNRLIERVSADETVQYAYDAAGKRISMADPTGITRYEYDPVQGSLTRLQYPDGQELRIAYDANGNRTEAIGPFGSQRFFRYDAMNRLAAMGTFSGAEEFKYTYYANGLLNQSTANGNLTTKHRFNGTKLTEKEQVRGQHLISRYQYEYDANNNIQKRTQNDVVDTFAYDPLDRIAESSIFNEVYTYDKLGNRLILRSEQWLETPSMNNTFDAQDRLIQVATEDKTVQYIYNGDGLLVERVENGVRSRYYYDGSQMIAEAEVVNGQPVHKATYIRGNALEAIDYADGSRAYVLSNGHGDITELQDESGQKLNKYVYDLWGNILSQEEQVHNPFRYSGEYWDDTTKLQYLRARWYDPSVGRFINEDTYEGLMENPQSQNLYSYVLNNPLIYVDPTGHYCVSKDGNWAHAGKCNNSNSNYLGDDKYLTGLPIIERGILKGWLNIGSAEERKLNYYKDSNNWYFTSLTDRGVKEDELSWFIIETAITGGVSSVRKAALSLIKGAQKTKTVWSFIRGTQNVIEGTVIPKSFELTTRNAGKLWVHPNATKHMEEYVKRYISHSYTINQQALLTSFKSAVDYATKKGIVYDTLINVGGWELKFSKKPGDALPVIIHAVFK
ncbi:RHS repeat domain-containing protein [Paenibacillus ihbetae]|uniref:RHS repeat domain-containing protein n=1 Tax=Paenibacillus ihbetae TaxID=1870820 RepID=UPI001CB9CAA8|nr:RHS repeat-associated core domain-containing protein [Paenibacillus ihbetae]